MKHVARDAAANLSAGARTPFILFALKQAHRSCRIHELRVPSGPELVVSDLADGPAANPDICWRPRAAPRAAPSSLFDDALQ